MKNKDFLELPLENNMEVVTLDLNIEVLEHSIELMASAGACSSSSSSCSNINIELLAI